MSDRKAKLGKLLLDAGLVSERDLNAALCYQKNQRCLLGASLVKLGFLTEDALLDFLADNLGLERIDLGGLSADPALLEVVPMVRALAFTVFPVERRDLKGTPALRMAMADPCNLTVIDALEFMIGMPILPVLASERDIHAAIEKAYGHTANPGSTVECVGVEENISKTAISNTKIDKLIELLEAKGLLSAHELQQLKQA